MTTSTTSRHRQPTLLVLGQLPAPYDSKLQERFSCFTAISRSEVADIVARHAEIIAGIVLVNEIGVDKQLISSLPSLRMIANFGAGYDDIDLTAAASHGVIISNTPHATTEEVADVAMALLVMAARRLSEGERFLRAGHWTENRPFELSMGTLRNRRLGILGFGRIGQAVARRASGFGLPVGYHSRNPVAESGARHFPTLEALAEYADTLIVCVGGGPDTFHLVNASILELLGPSGLLVNVGRGTVVDTTALISSLRKRRILGAALDVYENEPHVPPALLELPNLVLTPHLASGSIETHRLMAKATYENVVSFFETGRPLTPIKGF